MTRHRFGIALLGAALSAGSPLITGALRGLAYAALMLLVLAGLIVVALARAVQAALVGAL